ncbi:MAG TPA: poly-gamma-glutamate system protein [Candidatus Aminicenantes bacterium]|nr:poly-gamma-glutamate system protein [Candidatus Aminicenantes bacterium]HRY64629.1 poly-gamma-glutamate system protein [Candidatus Aminicenantes bacterium]HRZ71542.1 poly-gamma-glutamate system protein [Candidatus Aminicenantes bacterium]
MKSGEGRSGPAAVYAAAALSLAYLLTLRFLPPPPPPPAVRAAALEASRLMAAAETALRECRAVRGIPVDPAADPNGTGLIGVETSEITTSTGRLEAKRTTTNPAFAGLLVSLLDQAGVRRGDVVAVGASSSFPALIVATLAAARALGAVPLIVSSLGASEWGGNLPAFSWLDMEECLREKGLFDVRPIARAVGGEGDVGRDLSLEGRDLLAARIRADAGPAFLEEPDLERNVARRLALYREAAAGRPIRAFVNIGGSWANLGTDAEVLTVAPGLAGRIAIPPPPRRGVLQAMAAAGVPVIHLLNVRGLCERYGLPWDPRPLPEPGQGRVGLPSGSPVRTLLTAGYLAGLAVLLALLGRRRPGL